MSRYVLRDDDMFEVVVGWDRPLMTYFAQVFDREEFARRLRIDRDADEVVTLWVGTAPYEIEETARLRELVTPWAQLDSEMERRLMADKGEPDEER